MRWLVRLAAPFARRRSRNWGDMLFGGWTWLMSTLILALICLLMYHLYVGSRLSLARYGWSFLTSQAWDPVKEQFGALPAIYGTVVSSLLALAIAGPLGLLAAIFLAELAPRWLDSPLSFLIELLASIPSVVYGLWGIYVLVPILRDPVGTSLQRYLGFLPFFSGTPIGFGMMAGVAILSIMILPYGTAVARDVLRAVPNEQREAMLALGATRWETIRAAILPYARSGIIGGLMLALGRAVGETMAVTMLIGNRHDMSLSLFSPAYTLASQIANEFTEATSDLYVSVLIELGLVLFAITLALNGVARILVWRVSRNRKGART